MSRIMVGPARRSISDISGLFQPSMNIASAVMNIGADEQADDVVDEGGLAALVPVADELDQPADDEEARAPAEPDAEAAARDLLAEPEQHADDRR